MEPLPPPHDLKFAFSDFIRLLKRHKKTMVFAVLLGALSCFLFAVTRPVVYLVQASFRDKGKTEASIRSSLSDLFLSSSPSHDSEAISTMKSRFFVGEVSQKLDAQGYIVKFDPAASPEVTNATDNLFAEWAYWASYRKPILEDPEPPLKLTGIHYPGEVVQVYLLTWKDLLHFDIQDEEGQALGVGELGQPVHLDKTQFTVMETPLTKIQPKELFVVVIFPMKEISELYGGHLLIDVDREDKTLLKLQFKHRNRKFAADFLNTLMETYQKYLEAEHDLTSNSQVNYLERRQNEIGANLEKLMEEHLLKVSEDMSQSGFTSLEREMDFLAAHLANNQQKLTEIDLETKRLHHIDVDECVHYDSYTVRGDPANINHLLAEIRMLKQQADGIELSLQNTYRRTPEETKIALEKNFHKLESSHACMKEASELVSYLRGERREPLILQSLYTSDFPVATWYQIYKGKEKAWVIAPIDSKSELQNDFEEFREHFLTYLDTFQRMMHIQASTLEQRMRTQQNPAQEFVGMNLDTGRNLYLAYVREHNELEAHEKQHRFTAEQLKNPDFELSSLTALLHDPISHDRIAKATQLMIQLKDENNRTQKELERLREELDLQKVFLTSHIGQMAELLKLKQELLREKMDSLLGVTLDLTHQQISLLKKHLRDYIESRIDNLLEEKKLLLEHQASLHSRMATIPSKWASEKLMNQNLALQQRFLENLANMVESKNITRNLEMIQSTSLDKAIPPLNPKPPRLLFYTLFGSILGFLGGASFLFTRTMIRGIPASLDNLSLANFHTSGSLTPFHGDEQTATPPFFDTDLNTFRRLIAHFENLSIDPRESKTVLILKGKGPDFSNTLAKLLSKKGQKTVKLQLGFKTASSETAGPGLLQYLEGAVDQPEIQSLDGFDLIPAGGVSRYSEELLRSPRFNTLLNNLRSSYTWILGVSPASIPSAEAENLARLFDGTVVVFTDETLPDLIAFSKTLDEAKREALTFVCSRSSGG